MLNPLITINGRIQKSCWGGGGNPWFFWGGGGRTLFDPRLKVHRAKTWKKVHILDIYPSFYIIPLPSLRHCASSLLFPPSQMCSNLLKQTLVLIETFKYNSNSKMTFIITIWIIPAAAASTGWKLFIVLLSRALDLCTVAPATEPLSNNIRLQLSYNFLFILIVEFRLE